MASDKTAEAALTLSQVPAFRPFARLLDRLRAGHLRIGVGDAVYDLRGPDPGPSGEIRIRHPLDLARRLATRGHVGLGEAYMAGAWDSPDPAALIQVLAINEPAFAALVNGTWISRIGALLRHRWRANTRAGSRRNIAHHYDLGNDFYRLWLDSGMTYSAALFDGKDRALEQAQTAKYQRLLDLLDATPGARLLEIGCGWGGFAQHAAARGFEVTGVTLSREQLDHARRRIEAAGLGDRVELRLQDYRDLTGRFDHIVSIEMFEAVGETYWPTYMAQLCARLLPGGRAALQIITIAEDYFAAYKANPDFIQHYIFPGGMLPSIQRFDRLARDAGLTLGERQFHGLDYARTLALWHRNFVERRDAIRALGYSERFIRMWRYYLAYCEAGFREGRINVMQVVLAKPARAF